MTKSERWVRACGTDELEAGAGRVFRHAGLQIALFRRDGGELHAIDNHCPHEGYPLVQGYVKDCLLTCAWHNFKFDLRDGRCVIGTEDVRTWPVRERDGVIEVDVERDTAADAQRVFASLEEGLYENQLGRVARDAARLIAAGVAPVDVLGYAARFDARRAEYGTTHALPLATDVATLVDGQDGLDAVHGLVFALDMAAEPNVRRPERERPAPLDPGTRSAAEIGTRLCALVESEDGAGAEGLVRGALAAGFERTDVEPWFWRLAAAHFLDFGHAAIYVRKAFDLLERIGWEHADELLGALVFRIVNGTREDTLPPWAAFAGRLDELTPELSELWQRRGTATDWDPRGLYDVVLDGNGGAFFGVLRDELRRGVDPVELTLAIGAAAGERIRRFDLDVDRSVECQDGWLFVTHTLTFANAVRAGLTRFDAPDALRLVAFAARFVNGMRALDAAAVSDTGPPTGAATVAGALAAIRAGRSDEAIAQVTALVRDPGSAAELERALGAATLADGAVRPIVAAHVIKTTVAAFEEHRALATSSHPGLRALADRPLAGLAHFLSAPVTERSRARIAHEAVQFVGHGKIPKILSS